MIRRWGLRLAALGLMLILCFPLPVRNMDRERVVARSAQRLRDQKPVLLDWRYQPFYDAQLIAARVPRWHYLNETDLNCHLLDEMGFERLTETDRDDRNWPQWFEEGNAYVMVTTRDSWHDRGIRCLRFNVHFGYMGGQGYRLRIYRCLLGTFTWYRHEWSV